MNVSIEFHVQNDLQDMRHNDIHTTFLYDSTDGVIPKPSNHEIYACVVFLGAPRCRNFVVGISKQIKIGPV